MGSFLDPANALTILGANVALLGALAATGGRVSWGAIGLVVAGVCDLLDGLLARRASRNPAARRFGARLDSLCDACSFGFAPAVLLHAAGMRAPQEILLLAFLLTAALWRLAFFDVVGLEAIAGARYYRGLPTTYVALLVPLALPSALAGRSAFRSVMAGVVLLTALAMLSALPVRKPTGRAYPFFVALALAVVTALLLLGPRIDAALHTVMPAAPPP